MKKKKASEFEDIARETQNETERKRPGKNMNRALL